MVAQLYLPKDSPTQQDIYSGLITVQNMSGKLYYLKYHILEASKIEKSRWYWHRKLRSYCLAFIEFVGSLQTERQE